MKYATETNLYSLLPFMKFACPENDFMLVWHKDGRYGFHVDPKILIADKRGKFRHFELLVKNDFELELNKLPELYTKVNLGKYNKIFRLGMTALLGFEYKSALDDFLFQQHKNDLI